MSAGWASTTGNQINLNTLHYNPAQEGEPLRFPPTGQTDILASEQATASGDTLDGRRIRPSQSKE